MNLKSPTGIYIHIPFCYRKCSYCNFYSIAKPNQSLMTDYITCLCNEITQTIVNYRFDHSSISSIYLGGGTPNILPLNLLDRLVDHIEDQFKLSFSEIEETTIEINPGLSDYNYLKSLRDLGFNRLSIGIQTLDNNLLKLMRRVHNKNDAIFCLENSIKVGFDNISCDLIFNYPTQTEAMVISDLKTLINYPITHISAYSLSVEPKTILSQQIKSNQLLQGDESSERETYYHINELLKINKFSQYEISNYAKEGFESQQNNLYWSLGSYYGFGPASSSFINGIRIDHPADLKSYLKNNPIPQENILNLTEKELKEEFMFLGLRKIKGIDDQEYINLFGSSFFKDFEEAINRCLENNWIQKSNSGLKLTKTGIDFADRVALEFLL